MRRILATVAVVSSCLAFAGAPAGAQSPAVEAQAAWVTGASSDCTVTSEGTRATQGAVEQVRDLVVSCSQTASDPRFSGTMTNRYNEDCYAGSGCVYWGTGEVVGPDGTWTHSYGGTIDAARTVYGHFVDVGSGAYDGWTIVGAATSGPGEEGAFQGLLYQGAPPPSAE